jgi:N-ethylmaleimide reductase
LETDEILRVIDDHRRAARNAELAGFDYAELHAAHGYLVEQFLCDGINKREDRYGGSIENRSRFLFEVVVSLVAELGPGRVGVRLSPASVDPATGNLHQMYFGAVSSDAVRLYDHAVAGLNDFALAYLMLAEPRVGALSVAPQADRSQAQPLRNTRFHQIYRGMLIEAGGFTPRTAKAAVAEGQHDLVAVGRWFLANPDLPNRLRTGSPLNVCERETFFGSDVKGYTDYPGSREIGDPLFGDYPLMAQSQINATLKRAILRQGD